jgi:hypothetical protein
MVKREMIDRRLSANLASRKQLSSKVFAIYEIEPRCFNGDCHHDRWYRIRRWMDRNVLVSKRSTQLLLFHVETSFVESLI